MTTAPLHLWRRARIATMAGASAATQAMPYGLIERGALLTEGGHIRWVGAERDMPADLAATLARSSVHEHNLQGALVTPGLVDCHTHLVYGGRRADEFEQRLNGATYEQIARAGGGIRSTVRATREASEDDLFEAAAGRAQALLDEGVTSIEIKSGYGLDEATEARCLRVARRIGQALPMTVRTTSLGAHALPPEYDSRPDDYIAAVCAWLPAQQAAGLVDAVDVFCDTIGFTPEQTRRVFEAARALGLPIKLHAEQLSDQHGAALAAAHGALSCDHLEWLGDDGVRQMAASGTVAVLLPGAYYFLRETKLPPVAALREASVPIAIASDHNPGSSPGLSLLLMLNMACTFFRLTPEEALRGVTLNAARALGLGASHGSLEPGKQADAVVWDLEHPNELSYWFGRNPCRAVIQAGVDLTPVVRPVR
ncbi:MAG: imidazolonepropionase [Aquabacterium sp.]